MLIDKGPPYECGSEVGRPSSGRGYSSRPFPHHCWDAGKFGSNWQILSRVYDAYWLSQAVPDRISIRDTVPGVYWLFGLHPVNDLTFVLGTEFPSPQYMSDSILWARFGDQPAVKPGAMVPGLGKYQPAGLLFYLDNPWAIFNNESGIHDAPKLIFAMPALEQVGQLPCFADEDAVINLDDVQAVADDWQNPSFDPAHDLNKDGEVDVRDVASVIARWGEECTP